MAKKAGTTKRRKAPKPASPPESPPSDESPPQKSSASSPDDLSSAFDDQAQEIALELARGNTPDVRIPELDCATRTDRGITERSQSRTAMFHTEALILGQCEPQTLHAYLEGKVGWGLGGGEAGSRTYGGWPVMTLLIALRRKENIPPGTFDLIKKHLRARYALAALGTLPVIPSQVEVVHPGSNLEGAARSVSELSGQGVFASFPGARSAGPSGGLDLGYESMILALAAGIPWRQIQNLKSDFDSRIADALGLLSPNSKPAGPALFGIAPTQRRALRSFIETGQGVETMLGWLDGYLPPYVDLDQDPPQKPDIGVTWWRGSKGLLARSFMSHTLSEASAGQGFWACAGAVEESSGAWTAIRWTALKDEDSGPMRTVVRDDKIAMEAREEGGWAPVGPELELARVGELLWRVDWSADGWALQTYEPSAEASPAVEPASAVETAPAVEAQTTSRPTAPTRTRRVPRPRRRSLRRR